MPHVKKTITLNPKSIFSVIVALIPVLSPYASLVRGIYLEEFILILMTLIAVFYKREFNSNKKMIPFYLLAIEILISIIFNILFQFGETTNVLVRSIRMLFYILCICFTANRLLDLKKTMKAITYISIFSVVFLFVQVVLFRTTGFYLKGMGYILPLAYRADFDYQYYMSIRFRPSSIFSEPAAMCEYLLVPILFLLLGERTVSKKNTIIAAILSFGCLLTTSLWGIVIVISIWSIWLFKTEALKKYFLILIISIPILMYLILNSSFLSTAMDRIDLSSLASLISSESFSGRFMGYDSLKNLDYFEKIFGLGFGNLGVRSEIGTGNSVVYYLLGLGLLGTFTFYVSLLFSLKYYDSLWQKLIIVFMIVLSFGAGTLNTCLIMYFVIVSVYTNLNHYEKDSTSNISIEYC